MPIFKRVSPIKSGNLRSLVPALMVLLISFGPWISVHAQEVADGTPSVIVPAPAEPAPVTAPEIPSPVEPAPAPPAPVETAPALEDAVPPTEVVPVVPAEPAPAVDEPVEVAVPPTDVPAAPVETPTEAAIIPADPSGESEDDPAETSGTDPGTETIVTAETPVEPVVATEVPSPTPTTAATPTPSPTVVPSPTPEPTPVITWSQPEPVACTLLDGEPAGLRYNQNRTYRCQASTTVSSDLEMPTDMTIRWNVSVDFNGDAVDVSFPERSAATITKSVPGNHAGAVKVELSHPWIKDSELQQIDFTLTISRTTCVVGEQVLSVDADPIIENETTKAEIKFTGLNEDPARFISPVIAADAPTVAFDGPVTFESLLATSAGLESDSTPGSATLLVSGAWDPCHTWTLNMSGTVDVPLEAPAHLRVVSTNNESISGDACDLQTACDVIVLPETGNAATPLRYTIGLELELNQFTPVGVVGVTVSADLASVEAQP